MHRVTCPSCRRRLVPQREREVRGTDVTTTLTCSVCRWTWKPATKPAKRPENVRRTRK